MEVREEKRQLVVKLGPGEPVVGSLVTLARGRGLPGASVRAIGAVGQARIGFFVTAEKRYRTCELRENLEVVSLLGNLAHSAEGPIAHLHVSLGRGDFSVIGGHLFEAVVSVTLEMFVTPTSERLERRRDPRFELNLLALE
jgi:predicted DNA-binding protein with PD1-like motif